MYHCTSFLKPIGLENKISAVTHSHPCPVSLPNSLVFYLICQTSPLATQTRSLLMMRRWWGKREGVWRSNGGQGYAWPLMDRGCEGRWADAILVNAGITGWNCDTAGRSSNGQCVLRVPGRGQHQRALPLLAASGRAGKKGLGREGRGREGAGWGHGKENCGE